MALAQHVLRTGVSRVACDLCAPHIQGCSTRLGLQVCNVGSVQCQRWPDIGSLVHSWRCPRWPSGPVRSHTPHASPSSTCPVTPRRCCCCCGLLAATATPAALLEASPWLLPTLLATASFLGVRLALSVFLHIFSGPSSIHTTRLLSGATTGGPLSIGLGAVFISSFAGMIFPAAAPLMHSVWLYGGLALFSAFVLYVCVCVVCVCCINKVHTADASVCVTSPTTTGTTSARWCQRPRCCLTASSTM